MKKGIKDKILELLVNPMTPTEIKKDLGNVSFGTIAYHLKNLEELGIIKSSKNKKKQGQPTKYELISKEYLAIMKEASQHRKNMTLIVLREIKNNPGISDDQLIINLKNKGYDDMEDYTFEPSNDNLSTIHHKITPKGEKFLKENP